MYAIGSFWRTCFAGMGSLQFVLSELAWLQAEEEMTKLLAAPARTDKSGVR